MQIVRGVDYLHSFDTPIMHRDLKPENLLVDKGRIMIADFGCSALVKGTRNTYCGTPDYVAPEVVMGQQQTEKVDIWGLGVLLFEMLTGKSPFSPTKEDLNRYDYMTQLKDNIIKGWAQDLNLLSDSARDLFQRLVHRDPSKRPTAKQILHHPWILSNMYAKQSQGRHHAQHDLQIQDLRADQYFQGPGVRRATGAVS